MTHGFSCHSSIPSCNRHIAHLVHFDDNISVFTASTYFFGLNMSLRAFIQQQRGTWERRESVSTLVLKGRRYGWRNACGIRTLSNWAAELRTQFFLLLIIKFSSLAGFLASFVPYGEMRWETERESAGEEGTLLCSCRAKQTCSQMDGGATRSTDKRIGAA